VDIKFLELIFIKYHIYLNKLDKSISHFLYLYSLSQWNKIAMVTGWKVQRS